MATLQYARITKAITLVGGRCKVATVVEAGDAVNLNSLFATLYL